jgi:hypothetical protein
VAASAPSGADDEPAETPDATRGAGRGGEWLTYRFRLGGEDTPEATGTMKAPSFLSAARRILARGLVGTLGPTPAYLRLRAAGEEEVLLRVVRPDPGATAEPRLDVVPGDAYRFVQRADLLAPGQDADPSAP